MEAVTYFEYGKSEEGYWTGEHLLDQIQKKALPIGEALYPGYALLFLFDNATSHSIYAQDALQVANMNKGLGGQKPFLRPGWFMGPNHEVVVQEMSTVIVDSLTGQSTILQKGIQAVLVERGLWPQGGVRLECEKPKCSNCQTLTICRICVRGRKCDSCKEAKEHSGKCTKRRICDACNLRKERCQCITKIYCTRCKEISIQKSCVECEKNPPKCSSESEFLFNNLLYYTNF